MNIGVIGTGSVARTNYLPYLAKREDVTLTYFSRTPGKADACAREFGGRVAGSIGELLADQPDAILVLTLETQRYEAVLPLLEGRPRRLFFEKPLVAQNGQDRVCEDDFLKARELLARCTARGTETAMVFNYRFLVQTARMKRIIAERHFGKLIHASMYVSYASWSHCIDLLHLFGGRASVVSALQSAARYRDAVDVAGAFRLENGATGTILGTNATNGARYDFPLYHLTLNFEQGTIRLSDLDGPMEVFDAATRYSETYALYGKRSRRDQYNESFEKSLDAYLDSVQRNAPPPVPGTAGLEELQFEAALRRSVEQKRPVDVQGEFPLS